MRHFYNLLLLFAISFVAASSSYGQDPVLFSTGGSYGAAGNHVKLYTYHPEQDTIFVQDSVPGDFSNDVLYDGKYCYLHIGREDSTDAIYQYDPYTFERLDSISPISGTQNLGVHNEHLVVTRGFGTSSASEYVRVYDRNNISAGPTWNEDSIGNGVNGLAFRGDSAFLGYTQNDSGYIATLDLSGATPSFGDYHPLDTMAGGINQLIQDSDSIYALSERSDASFNLLYAGVTAYDPATGSYTTDTNHSGASNAVLARNDSIWMSIENPIEVYRPSGGTYSQFFPVDYSGGHYQGKPNSRFYFQRTDFFSFGDLYITDGKGNPIDTFETDLSGTAIKDAAKLMVTADGDSTVCADDAIGANFSLKANTPTDTGSWMSSGSGSFNYQDSVYAEYQPSSGDTSNGWVRLSFVPEETGTYRVDTATVMLKFFKEGEVMAASMDSVCGSMDPVQLDASTNTSGLQWSTAGSGSFSDMNDPQASYAPSSADSSNGSVLLMAETMNSGSCASDKDSVRVMFGPLAPDAGTDKFMCATEDSVQLDGGYGMNATDSEWMSTGSGSFADKNDTNTAYGPSSNDKSNGSVQLILHTSNEGVCTMKDTIGLTIYPEPEAKVSKAPIHCIDNSPAQLDGNSNTGSGEWSTNGTGSFGDPTSLNTNYNFSASDESNGRVTVSLATTNNGTCQGDTTSKEIVLRPSVSTAPDIDTTVNADSVGVDGSLGNAATEWSWSSYGNGSFSDSSMLSTFYSPSEQDHDLGSVNLLLTASNQGDCPEDDVLNIDFTDTYVQERNRDELSMKLHPVPASSDLFVTLPEIGGASEAEFEIVDLTGRVLRDGELDLGTQQKLEVEDLHKGTYLLRVRTEDEELVRKWSKR